MRSTVILLFFIVQLFYQCKPAQDANDDEVSFLALGDSYTIGQGVSTSMRWPNQLRDSLTERGFSVKKPKIIAKTGWRTDNLLNAIAGSLDADEKFDMVSVLIGVNNQYQNRSLKEYEKELDKVFTEAIRHSKKGYKGVFALNIPDYGSAPVLQFKGDEIAKEIDDFNEVFKKIASKYQIPVYDVNSISKKAYLDAGLRAVDGLHPSGDQYTLWVQKIVPNVTLLLK